MKRVVVTGAQGFVGRHLAKEFCEGGYEVWGVDRESSCSHFMGMEHVKLDLEDAGAVRDLFQKAEPHFTVHLAAQSSAGKSFEEPLETLRNNLIASLNILDAVRTLEIEGRVLLVGSADEYGVVDPIYLPLEESKAGNPVNPYGLSKWVQTKTAVLYHELYGVDCLVARSFNHTGPGQRETFVLPGFARQIVEIRHGLRDPVIEVGNLELKRDFLDVRDVVRAYMVLLEKGRAGEVYNVSSGRSYLLKQLLEKMCKLAGVRPKLKVSRERMRSGEAPDLRGNRGKITRDTGWSPRIPIEDTLSSLLEYWEGVVLGTDGKGLRNKSGGRK